MNLGLPTDYEVVLRPLLTSPVPASGSYPPDYTVARKHRRPPGVSDTTFHLSRLIYPLPLQIAIGHLDSGLNYPGKQALYQVSVRHDTMFV